MTFGRVRRAASLVGALAFCLTLALPVGAGMESGPAASAQLVPDTLRIGFMQHVESLNPYIGLSEASRIFYGLVYDTLQSIGEDMDAVPDLALESRIVDVSGFPHGSVWEYTITHNAEWHDGQPFDAEDVAWNINLQCFGSNYTEMWSYQPYSYFAKYAEVVDPDTVRVTFYDRENGNLIPCAFGYHLPIHMLPRHLLSSYSTSFLSFAWLGYFNGVTPRIVGTGPFMVTPSIVDEFGAGDQITLVRNPNYHASLDRGKSIQFQNLVMRFYTDSTAMRYALQTGDIDVAEFPPDVHRSIANNVSSGTLPNIATTRIPKCSQDWTMIAFNMNDAGPNQWRLDPAARHALAQAVNKTFIIDNFYSGYGGEGSGLISPVVPYWHWSPSDWERWNYSLTEASAAFEAAGYVDTDTDGIRECTPTSAAVVNGWSSEGAELALEILVRAEPPEERQIAEYLGTQWSQIGVDVAYQVVAEANLVSRVYAYNYDSFIWFRNSDPDPNLILFSQSARSINGWSDNMYRNPAYDENYTLSVSELDPAKRREYVSNCQKISYDDAAYIILSYLDAPYAWRTDTFTGWGNWSAYQGRSIGAYWGANPLYFDLVPTNQNLGLIVREHAGEFRIPLPEDWIVEENKTVGGEKTDMFASGPINNGFMANILVKSQRDTSAKESAEYLSRLMNDTIEELTNSGNSVTLGGAAQLWNTTNYSAIGFELVWDSTPATQWIAIYANDHLNRIWVVVCSVDSTTYPMMESTFVQVTNGFEVIEEGNGGSGMLGVAIAAIVAAVAAVAVVVVLLLRRKPPSPAVTSAQGSTQGAFCPICGQIQALSNSTCERCGNLLPTPPFGGSGRPPPT